MGDAAAEAGVEGIAVDVRVGGKRVSVAIFPCGTGSVSVGVTVGCGVVGEGVVVSRSAVGEEVGVGFRAVGEGVAVGLNTAGDGPAVSIGGRLVTGVWRTRARWTWP